jgi:hypothetical protein
VLAEVVVSAAVTTPSILDLPHGVHAGIPNAVYHQRVTGLVSKGALDLVARSPAHYMAWLEGNDEEPTAALEFGSAFHAALLEPARFVAEYATEPDFGDCRRKEPKAARDAWRAANVGKVPVSADDDKAIRGMLAAVRAHPAGLAAAG